MKSANKTNLKPVEQPAAMAHLEGQSGTAPIKGYPSPFRILLTIAVLVFAAELFVMFLLDILPPLSATVESLVDTFILTMLIFPVLYFFLFRPLVLQLAFL